MPSTVNVLFKHVGLSCDGQVKWGEMIDLRSCGFYVVAITDSPDKIVSINKPIFNDLAINKWIKLVKSSGKNILIDKKIADLNSIKNRLSKFWHHDETIVYIGKAGPNIKRTLRRRTKEYYESILGCNKKHAGGHWIKTLQNLPNLNVFYSCYSGADIQHKEELLISYFLENVSKQSKDTLLDQDNCYPFANLELHRKFLKMKIRKKHGLNNQTIDCQEAEVPNH